MSDVGAGLYSVSENSNAPLVMGGQMRTQHLKMSGTVCIRLFADQILAKVKGESGPVPCSMLMSLSHITYNLFAFDQGPCRPPWSCTS